MDENELLNYDALLEKAGRIESSEYVSQEVPEAHRSHVKQIIAVLCLFAVIIISGFIYKSKKITQASVQLIATQEKTSEIPPENPFKQVTVDAKGYYLFDIKNNRTIAANNEVVALPLASLTKIMTAVTALDILKATSTIKITRDALVADGDSGLYVDEKWNFNDLLAYTLTVSSNDGATAIAAASGAILTNEPTTNTSSFISNEQAFIEAMNNKAKSIGLTSTHFSNESGLDLTLTEAGAYGSAQDVATLFTYTLREHPEVFEISKNAKITVASQDNINHTGINTNIDIDKIPDLIASKTGFSDLAGGNLAVVYDSGVGRPIIAVVLGSTYDGRFTDMMSLITAANQYLSEEK